MAFSESEVDLIMKTRVCRQHSTIEALNTGFSFLRKFSKASVCADRMGGMISIRVVTAILILATSDAPIAAQTPGWTSHTSFRQVQALDGTPDVLWIATRGGVYRYTVSGGEIDRFTVAEGLHGVDARTVAVDPRRSQTWIGYGDGTLDRIDWGSRKVDSFRDIERASQFSARGINRISVRGDSLLISTNFGIVVFDPVKLEVRDSYTRLGTNTAATAVHDVTVGPDQSGILNFWAATEDGIAHAPVHTTNLQDPTQWTNERIGLPVTATGVLSVQFFEGSLFVGTVSDLYKRELNGTFSRLFVTSEAVTQLRTSQNRLIGVERFRLIVVEPGGQTRIVSIAGLQDPTSVLPISGTTFWVGDLEGGLVSAPSPSATDTQINPEFTVIPAGPFEGVFTDLDIDEAGTLWAGGASAANTGFHRFDPTGGWTTFSTHFNTELSGTSRFTRVHADASGMGWAGSEGSGVASVSPDGEVVLYGPGNSSLRPATGTSSFVIVGGLDSDSDGNLWVTTRGSGFPLHRRTVNGDWQAFGPQIGDGLSSRSTAYGRIFNDSFDEKWIIIRDENDFNRSIGVMVLETGDPALATDDQFQFFGNKGGAGQGLPAIGVTSVAEDRDGLVWVGTESGPAYFVNTGVVARDGSATAIWPQWADRSLGTFMLFGLTINDVAVDPANRIWFATNDGAWLVESVEGGYAPVEHFTRDNSPLLSDVILSIAVDDVSGRVFFSTETGLISFGSDAVAPSKTAEDLFVFPNPVRIENGLSPDVSIQGLVEETDIRIVTVSGSLVRRISGRGGRVTWDGRDERGDLVDSGIYLVVAVGKAGEGAARGKIAVIR